MAPRQCLMQVGQVAASLVDSIKHLRLGTRVERIMSCRLSDAPASRRLVTRFYVLRAYDAFGRTLATARK